MLWEGRVRVLCPCVRRPTCSVEEAQMAQRSLSLNDPPQLAVQSKSLAQQRLLNAQTIFDHNPSIHFVAQKCTLAVCSIHKYVV